MELFGVPLETVYLYTLVISGGLTLFLILFNDVFAGIDGPDFLNPVLIVAFMAVFSASGFIFEKVSSLQELLAAGLSALIGLLIVSLLNIFVLIPLASAEESLSFHESALKGRVGRVLTSVPEDGFGEVLIEGNSGSIAKPAASFENEGIPALTRVLIVDVKNGILYVTPYLQIEDIN